METQTIFYSWQSDLPNSTNRGFIESALKKAVKKIKGDDSLQIEPVIDRDTLGIPGSPDIAKTILEKIDKSLIFVCDISIINLEHDTRPTPNPNVLLELGYAIRSIGFERIIMICNTEYGAPELLPFDLRQKRVIPYQLSEDAESKSEERNKLAAILEKGITTILLEQAPMETIGGATIHEIDGDWLEQHRSKAFSGLRKAELSGYMEIISSLPNGNFDLSHSSLLDATSKAQIDTFGWPIGVTIENHDHKRAPIADGIVSEISALPLLEGTSSFINRDSYDYWTIKTNGDFYCLKSLFEDDKRPADRFLFFNTRIIRVTESLLYIKRLYTLLGAEEDQPVFVQITHGGLKDRLMSATGSRILSPITRKCIENEIVVNKTIVLSTIDTDTPQIVADLCKPLFTLFDFFEVAMPIYEDIIEKFKKGKVS